MLFRFLTLFTFSLTSMSMTVIDVRTEAEWNTGHLEGALHIEWQEILKISSDIKKDEEIFLYCRSGNRSGKATKILLEAGYVNAKNAGSILNASQLLNIKIID
jgi:phage shock protein E